MEAQRNNLKPEKGVVWSQGSDCQLHCPGDGGRKGKRSQLASSYDRERNSPSKRTGEIDLGN